MDAKEAQRSLRQELDDTEERHLRETIVMLQESYAKAAKPYIDRLVMITSRRPPAPIVIPLEQAEALGLMTANDLGNRRDAGPIGGASAGMMGWAATLGD